MTKNNSKTDTYDKDIRPGDISQQILDSRDLENAFETLARHLEHSGTRLLSVKIQDSAPDGVVMRPFINLPDGVLALSDELSSLGGCPYAREAKRRGVAFDSTEIDRKRYTSFLDRRFFEIFDEAEHKHTAIVPIFVGRGIAQFNIGLFDQSFSGRLKSLVLETIAQAMPAIVQRFPAIATIFETKHLSDLEREVLTHSCTGSDIASIGQQLQLSGYTVRQILNNAARKLQASNQRELAYKAALLGEIEFSTPMGLQ